MDYVRHDFKTGEVLTADSLNHLEDGIALAMEAGGGVTKTTYAELKALRDAGQLKPGAFYQITDYKATTTQEGTAVDTTATFDIVVIALTTDTLSERARAAYNETAPLDGFNVNAWDIWYCLDNNKARFAWADEENGKGVIYRMIDEFGNDLPFDFYAIYNTAPYAPNGGTLPPGLFGFSIKSLDNLVQGFVQNIKVCAFKNEDMGAYAIPNIRFVSAKSKSVTIGAYSNNISFTGAAENSKIGSGCSNIVITGAPSTTIMDRCFNLIVQGPYNTFEAGCSYITSTGGTAYNTFAEGCNNLNISSQSFADNKVLKTEYVDISGSMNRCILLPYQGAGDYYDKNATECIVAMSHDAEQVNINIKDLASWWANK